MVAAATTSSYLESDGRGSYLESEAPIAEAHQHMIPHLIDCPPDFCHTILAEGAIALSVTLSGGALFAS